MGVRAGPMQRGQSDWLSHSSLAGEDDYAFGHRELGLAGLRIAAVGICALRIGVEVFGCAIIGWVFFSGALVEFPLCAARGFFALLV